MKQRCATCGQQAPDYQMVMGGKGLWFCADKKACGLRVRQQKNQAAQTKFREVEFKNGKLVEK